MVWDFGSAVSSQQQAAGDLVQRTAIQKPAATEAAAASTAAAASRRGATRALDPDESEWRDELMG